MVPKGYQNGAHTVEKGTHGGLRGPRGDEYGPNGVQTRKNLEKVRSKGHRWDPKWRPKTVKCPKSDEKRLPEERLGGTSEKRVKNGVILEGPICVSLMPAQSKHSFQDCQGGCQNHQK